MAAVRPKRLLVISPPLSRHRDRATTAVDPPAVYADRIAVALSSRSATTDRALVTRPWHLRQSVVQSSSVARSLVAAEGGVKVNGEVLGRAALKAAAVPGRYAPAEFLPAALARGGAGGVCMCRATWTLVSLVRRIRPGSTDGARFEDHERLRAFLTARGRIHRARRESDWRLAPSNLGGRPGSSTADRGKPRPVALEHTPIGLRPPSGRAGLVFDPPRLVRRNPVE